MHLGRIVDLEHEHDRGDRPVGRSRELDSRPILGRMALLGERDPRAGRHERRIRRIVVHGLHLEAERVAVERERALEVGDREDRPRAADVEPRHQLWLMPPSATIIWPVTQPASSEARNATAGAMSTALAAARDRLEHLHELERLGVRRGEHPLGRGQPRARRSSP